MGPVYKRKWERVFLFFFLSLKNLINFYPWLVNTNGPFDKCDKKRENATGY